MGALQKVLVVDDGHRAVDRALSAELAELGYASVTASLEAADDVLAMMPRPAAVLLHVPPRENGAFRMLAERLREQMRIAGVPVIVVDGADIQSGSPIDLQSRIGTRVLNEPEF
jgi:ethanolamine utilization protein EutA (predicted chaperonin)